MIIPLGARAKSFPPESDPYWDYVELLLKFNEADGATTIADLSSHGRSQVAINNCSVKTGEGRFGTGALKITGGTPHLYYSLPNVGTGAFTIECWYKTPNTSGTVDILTYPYGNPGVARCTTNACATDNVTGNWGSLAISTNTYYHLALCKSGSDYLFFRNGELGGTSTGASFGTSSVNAGTNGGTNDYIDSIRLTKGIARYTGSFTPPTTDFPERGP
jgi:hypothetical protein